MSENNSTQNVNVDLFGQVTSIEVDLADIESIN